MRPPVRFMAVCAWFLWATLTPALAEPLASPLARPAVVVASKVDTEGALLGSMIALVLDRQRDAVPVDLAHHAQFSSRRSQAPASSIASRVLGVAFIQRQKPWMTPS